MPKLKISESEQRKRTAGGIIEKRMRQSGYDVDSLAVRMHFCTQTMRNKLNRPETFTLGELWQLCDILKVNDLERCVLLGGQEFESYSQVVMGWRNACASG